MIKRRIDVSSCNFLMQCLMDQNDMRNVAQHIFFIPKNLSILSSWIYQ